MCGIFGFVMKKPLSMAKVFRALQKLEVSIVQRKNDLLAVMVLALLFCWTTAASYQKKWERSLILQRVCWLT
jgi:hypothetical protein